VKNAALIEQSKWFGAFRKLQEQGLLLPCSDFLFVEEMAEVEIQLKSGLVVPKVESYKSTMHDLKSTHGLVLMTGPGQLFEDSTLLPPTHEVGDVVLLPQNVEWFSQFFGIDCSKNRIGRVRDSQIPLGTSDYNGVQGVLRGYL
jgi:co-chaperonin GroES (HSP10)